MQVEQIEAKNLQQIINTVANRDSVKHIILNYHGRAGTIDLEEEVVNAKDIAAIDDSTRSILQSKGIESLTCIICGVGRAGLAYEIADLFGARVFASDQIIEFYPNYRYAKGNFEVTRPSLINED